MGFLVNTGIRPFIQKHSYLLSSQVPISALDYQFLNYDSFIDCSNIYDFKVSELKQPLEEVSNKTQKYIRRIIAISETIEERYIKLICKR